MNGTGGDARRQVFVAAVRSTDQNSAMRTSIRWGTIALVALLGAAEPLSFKALKARDAAAAYEKDMRKAQEEYDRRAAAARKAFRDALTVAKAVAMKKGDLDDANRMQAQIEQLTKELGEPPPRGTPQAPVLEVRSARYGAGQKWADVTELVQSHVRDGMLVEGYDNMPDPVPGYRKALIIEGTFGGTEFVLTDSESHKLTFGQPPSDKSQDKKVTPAAEAPAAPSDSGRSRPVPRR